MIIVLDECLPKKLSKLIPTTDQVLTVPQIGLAGSTDSGFSHWLIPKEHFPVA